jgi:hypothetical protein
VYPSRWIGLSTSAFKAHTSSAQPQLRHLHGQANLYLLNDLAIHSIRLKRPLSYAFLTL